MVEGGQGRTTKVLTRSLQVLYVTLCTVRMIGMFEAGK